MSMMKSALAVAKVTADLIQKGYVVFLPTADILRFDLVAFKDDKFLKIQVKYSHVGPHNVCTGTNRSSGNGCKITPYQVGDFDYYAIYLADVDTVIYPSLDFAGKCIRTRKGLTRCPSYWYEDFLEFTNNAVKTSNLSENVKSTYKSREKYRKVVRPSKEDLEKMVWEKPCEAIAKEFGVSGKAIQKWCELYEITKPSRGFWTKQKSLLTKEVSIVE
jgi:hypothetical protein